MAYLFLKGEMAKRNVTIENIAELLGMHRNSVANKINKNSSFSIEEAGVVHEKYFPDIELIKLFEKDGG
jgi:hypothetical protein